MAISIERFKTAVEQYLLNNQAKKLDMPKNCAEQLRGFMLFYRHRSNLFVLSTVHQFPYTQLDILLRRVGDVIRKDESLPARIEVYCSSVITIEQVEKLKELMRKYNVEFDILDKLQLNNFKEFRDIFSENEGEFTEIDEASKLLFSMLAEGNNVSEIKSNIICSIIIFLLNEQGSLTVKQLREQAEDRFQHEIGSIEQEIDFLLRKKRIEREKTNKELLKLTKNEQDTFLKLRQESKREEVAFHHEFFSLLNAYNIPDGSQLIEQLKSLYVESCEVNIDNSSNGVDDDKRKDQVFREFCNIIKGYLSNTDSTDRFLKELKDVCMNNPFLEKIGASEMFLSLYRSSKLEQFINSKKKYVYLDTRVLIYFYCNLASRGKNWPLWNDPSYRATYNLTRLVNKKNKDIHLRLSDSYLGEIAGELQKALRTAWFAERFTFKSKIPFQTNNVFYNFYLFLCESDNLETEKGTMKFSQFVKVLGLNNINPESTTFIKETRNAILKRIKFAGIEVMSVGRPEPHLYEETMEEWDIQNNSKIYQKSTNAIKADTKQLLHIVFQPVISDDKECEFYYASWDRTFTKMRDWVMDKSTKAHSFYIYNPARMANRFALSHFKIDSKCITHEVFFYADSQFKLRQKIGSLFDHVLVPFFGNKEEEGLDLMNLLVEIQDKYLRQHGPETGDEMTDDKLPLELVFDSIKQNLKRWQCSENDLFKYLSDKNNKGDVTVLFDEAFASISNKKRYETQLEKLGEKLFKYIHTGANLDPVTI